MPQNLKQTGFAPCISCGAMLEVMMFPSLMNAPDAGTAGKTVIEDSESGCFYHPSRKAEIVCADCGRFLCSLCDMELNGHHLCPACLSAGKKKRTFNHLEDHRFLYDSAALSMALCPMILIWLPIITAPIALYMVIRYWNAPTSIVRRSPRLRMIIAGLVSVFQILGTALFIYGIVS